MNKFLVILSLLMLSFTFSTFGQKISETSFSFGMNKPNHFKQDNLAVSYMSSNLIINATKSWYNNSHLISLRKEIGLNLQYVNVRYGIGNLERNNYFTGDIESLFASIALLAHLKFTHTLAFSLGPEAEFLVIGNNNVNHSYKPPLSALPYSGTIRYKGINRDYFNQPSYGIKARLFESNISQRATLGLTVSYLWTKHDYFNFNASSYTRLSMYIGWKKQKEKAQKKFNL